MVYHRDRERSPFMAADQCTDALFDCVCKPFSCKACSGTKRAVRHISGHICENTIVLNNIPLHETGPWHYGPSSATGLSALGQRRLGRPIVALVGLRGRRLNSPPVESKTRTHSGRVGSARRTADGGAGRRWAEQGADISVGPEANRPSSPPGYRQQLF